MIISRHFAFVELILVVLCGAVWMINPGWGIWFIPAALLPLAIRVIGGRFLVRSIDWLVVVFVVTAWVGYWAAYDQVTAWNKAWMIVTSALLYFSLKAQPRRNLIQISGFLFCLGVGVSLYYFLTHDFIVAPRKIEFVNQIGQWIMSIRPQTEWKPIHPNYVAGITAIMVPFIAHPVWEYKRKEKPFPFLYSVIVIVGLSLALFALFMATSRGVILAMVSGVGAWLAWRLFQLTSSRRQFKNETIFPILLLVYLCTVVAFLFYGPAQSGSIVSGNYFYGTGSRGELFARSLYLLLDYPITGGGLGSFPGLYSRYLLDIPFFNVPNSHNLFLNVGIEQGLFGGIAFLFMYLSSVWMTASSIFRERGKQVLSWVILFSLIVAFVHGMVDNYLYNGIGSMLSLFLVGI